MQHLLPWSYQLPEEWEDQLLPSTRDYIAAMIGEKKDTSYSRTISWIRCRLSFSLLRATIMAIRGARSSVTHGAIGEPIALQSAEGHLQND